MIRTKTECCGRLPYSSHTLAVCHKAPELGMVDMAGTEVGKAVVALAVAAIACSRPGLHLAVA